MYYYIDFPSSIMVTIGSVEFMYFIFHCQNCNELFKIIYFILHLQIVMIINLYLNCWY